MSGEVFERRLQLPVPAAEAFAWHERPGALDRLIPPWESARIVERGQGVCNGSIVKLITRLGPLKLVWRAEHHDYEAGHSFRDTQCSGPFAKWEHLHKFESDVAGRGTLVDRVEYRLPGGTLGSLLGGRYVRKKIDCMFDYRHRTTYADLAAHAKYQGTGIMRIAITGSSGLVGSTLVPLLTTGGHSVTRIVRRDACEGDVTWNPQADTFDAAPLDGIDAVVHLAGENIASSRWNARMKQRIRDSRVAATRSLCEGLAKMSAPPKVLVCASAIGFYGDRGEELLTEESPPGSSFLSDVVRDWEDATGPAAEAGIRVVNLRFGVILSPKSGALAKMLLPFKLGGGGRVGSGKQYWSWISIDDAVGAIHHAMMADSLAGPVNVVAPNPVTNLEFTKTLGRVLRRPTIIPMPAFAAKLALGEMADELLLASSRVDAKKLLQSGYEFRQPTLEAALRHLLGRT
ncbi:MAG: TIGR01777 family oxidoreductase [Planctomycetota bacterium]|nr:TIGR01777 family oxidoreductase [Planctomycetota bacterium]